MYSLDSFQQHQYNTLHIDMCARRHNIKVQLMSTSIVNSKNKLKLNIDTSHTPNIYKFTSFLHLYAFSTVF